MEEQNQNEERIPHTLDAAQIAEILPHRYPFALVDRITDFEPGKWAKGIKCVTINEPFFLGHFPGSAAVHFFDDHSHLGSLLRINTIEVPVRGKVTDFIEGKGEFFVFSRTAAG